MHIANAKNGRLKSNDKEDINRGEGASTTDYNNVKVNTQVVSSQLHVSAVC